MCQCGVWLRPNQSTLDRIREAFAALKTPYYRTRDVTTRGMKSGHNPWQKDHHKALDAKKGVQTRGKYTSKLDRWQKKTKYTERLNWCTDGLTCGSSASTTSPRLTSVMMHLTTSEIVMKIRSS